MTNAAMTAPIDWDAVVADNVRAELARERWTGRKAAAALGVTQTYVSRRLAGITMMSAADLQMFADLVGVPVARFFESPLSDSNRRPPLYIDGGSGEPTLVNDAECDWPGGWPDEDPKRKDAA
jgi:transcriptional regulator with XRE-family HTH domain